MGSILHIHEVYNQVQKKKENECLLSRSYRMIYHGIKKLL